MTDLTSLGYPQGYHMGLSAILWWITLFVLAVLAVMLYLNARKSDLINVKEMLHAKSFLYICLIIIFSLIQVGVLFPDYFFQLYFFGSCFYCSSFAFYIYNWEKNLTSIKRIPTLSAVASVIVALIAFITSIFFPDLLALLFDILIFTILSFITIALILYVYLIYDFSRNVKGVSTTVGGIWMGGMIFTMAVGFLEHPPGVKILPAFLVLYFTPIVLMISMSMAFYGINTLFAQISSYYAQTQKCAVHRGTIEKGNTTHYCPSCGIVYCETCFNQVIKKDGCWNCRQGADPELEKEWKTEQVLEPKKGHKPKNNTIKKEKQ